MAKNFTNSPDGEPPETVATRKRVPGAGRLRAGLGRLLADRFRVLLVLAVNLAVVVGIVSTVKILRNRKPPPKPVTLALALSALDRGNTTEARGMAERLAASKDITTEDWGGPDFILGTLDALEAEAASSKERAEAFRLAALYLARSRERGFPANREPAGLYLLGKSLCRCGRLEEALPVLEEALAKNAERASEIRLLLIETRMGVQPPELEKALAESRKLLADPQFGDLQRRQVLVEQAEILLRMNRGQECAAALDKIPDNPLLRSEISLLRGRLALAEGQALKKAASESPSPPAPLPEGEGRNTPPAASGKSEIRNPKSETNETNGDKNQKENGSKLPNAAAQSSLPTEKSEIGNPKSDDGSKAKFGLAIESFRRARPGPGRQARGPAGELPDRAVHDGDGRPARSPQPDGADLAALPGDARGPGGVVPAGRDRPPHGPP